MEKGTVIKVKHPKSGDLLQYVVVKEVSDGTMRLVNMNTWNVMNGFKTRDPENIRLYITGILGCEILSEEKFLNS